MEDETSLLFQRLLLLHPLQKHFEGSDDVYGVDSGPSGHHIVVDEGLTVVEGKHHLIDPAGLSLALYGHRGPLFDPVLRLLLCLISGVW